MYLGKIVEEGPKDAIFARPAHPYTRALLASTPMLDPRLHGSAGDAFARSTGPASKALQPERIVVRGELPSPLNPPGGCAFHTRCPYVLERCRSEVPVLQPLGKVRVSCHRAVELNA